MNRRNTALRYFDENRDFIDSYVNVQIEHNRKGNIRISAKDRDGNRHLFREKMLDNMLLELLNELTDNLANIDYAEDRDYEKNIEVIRLKNEMNELIQKPDTDSGEVIDKIMQLASLRLPGAISIGERTCKECKSDAGMSERQCLCKNVQKHKPKQLLCKYKKEYVYYNVFA